MKNIIFPKVSLVLATLIFMFIIHGPFIGVLHGAESRNAESWLSSLEGKDVVVIFIEALPDIGKELKARLTHVGVSGVVLKFGNDHTFFSYANIISIERAP